MVPFTYEIVTDIVTDPVSAISLGSVGTLV